MKNILIFILSLLPLTYGKTQLSDLPVTVDLTGRLFLDGTFFLQSPEGINSGAHLPETRLGGRLTAGPWVGRIDVGLDQNKVSLKDAFVQYNQGDNFYRIGYMLSSYTLDLYVSTNDLVFNTSAPSTSIFSVGRRVGITFARSVPTYHFSGGIFMGDKLTYAAEISPGVSASGRGVWLPLHTTGQILHIGTGMIFRFPDKDTSTGKRPIQLSGTGVTGKVISPLLAIGFEDVLHQTHNNVELLLLYNKFMFQSEFMHMHMKQRGLPDYNASGLYVQGGFLIKGRGYGYDLQEAVPLMPVDPHSLLLVARFDYVNLNNPSANLYGGRQKDLSVGLNYYFNRYISCRFNYNFIYTDARSAVGRNNIHLLQFRTQVRF